MEKHKGGRILLKMFIILCSPLHYLFLMEILARNHVCVHGQYQLPSCLKIHNKQYAFIFNNLSRLHNKNHRCIAPLFLFRVQPTCLAFVSMGRTESFPKSLRSKKLHLQVFNTHSCNFSCSVVHKKSFFWRAFPLHVLKSLQYKQQHHRCKHDKEQLED